MDLDTTLKNLSMTPRAIRSALEQICAIAFDDDVTFEIGKISPIREDDVYGGFRVPYIAKRPPTGGITVIGGHIVYQKIFAALFCMTAYQIKTASGTAIIA